MVKSDKKTNKLKKKMTLKKGKRYVSKSKKNTTNKLKKCAPFVRNNNALNNICYTEDGLIKIAKAWNKDHQDEPSNKIIIPKKSSSKSNKKSKFKFTKKQREKLWNDIKSKMDSKCNDDVCIKKKDFINNNIKQDDKDLDVFIPEIPEEWNNNPREWLNTININNVLTQYEKAYNDFIYLGAVPIDFNKKLSFSKCVANELCKINLKQLYKRGKKKIGVIFNTDPHDKPGQHWIAMFCDISNKIGHIYYWDSYGIEPPQEVLTFANKLKNQGEKLLNKNMEIQVNNNRHQYKNTECGMYSIHFIIQLLEGKSFNDVCSNIITDDDIAKYRKIYFLEHK